MSMALRLAKRGIKGAAPNPAVGAVIVKNDKVVARGYHARFGGPHAERVALAKAGGAARGATMYVTLEPCRHFGKTPPCTDAIIEAGIRKVVFAHRDPIEFISGKGAAQLKKAGIAVVEGVLREDAALLNLRYLKRARTGTPYVTLKWAMTLDGKIATASGDSRGISSKEALKYAHSLRRDADCVIIGIGTALADDPLLTCRLVRGRNPARIVLDGRCELPLESKLVRSVASAPVIVAATSGAPAARRKALEARGVEVLIVRGHKGRPDVKALLKELCRRNFSSVLVEGGGEAHAAFLESGLADEVCAIVCPRIIGGRGAATPVAGKGIARVSEALQLRHPTVRRLGADTAISGRLKDLSYYVGQ
jgi:diaminohydroxyphosphoribosylaminopyrimidine deaminase/5-amino-6-(5-phosphoribosylamino)uracil reductase